MNFELSEEQQMIKNTVRGFLEKEIAPLVEEYETERKPLPKALFKKLEPFGFTKALVPEEMGGLGLDFTSYFVMIEELARVWGSLRTLVTTSAMLPYQIAKRGTPEQRVKFLPGLLSMDHVGCFGLTEPNAGSDASAIETTAKRDGDYYVVDGTKTLITGGSMADIILLYATMDKSKKGKGITAFLVKKGESDFGARDIRKMGMHASVLSELTFDDCRIPAENRLGEEGEGLGIALGGLNIGRVTITFAVTGIAQAALEAAIRYARERVQFGKTIANYQLVQQMIVNMAMKVDTARLLGYRAAELLNKGVECRKETSFAKLFATESAMDVTYKAIQVHGGYGYTAEFPVERYYRDARHLTLAEGTSEIQQLIIGRDILGVSAIS
ncbi:MAG: acyl-CoA dehydrogenase family protein [Chloroflexota bacterium]|nr:acyl-CoA dehydrogenase family protein [Chloroflexota bacterium]